MELDSLCKVLQGCLSTSPEERIAAESCLHQHEKAGGQVVSLLRVAVEDRVDPAVRQVAAISFKNTVKRHWDIAEGKEYVITDADKAVVRENLLESLLRAPHVVQLQLGESLKDVVCSDYPESWPTLLHGVVQALQSNDQQRTFGALFALRILTRKYQFCDEEETVHLSGIVEASFPTLLAILQHINQDTSGSLPLAEAAKQLLKVFFYATFIRSPPQLADPATFLAWMEALHAAAVKDIPMAGMPDDADSRRKWPHWKAKKWAFRIIYRHLSRYSTTRDLEGADLAFAKMYSEKCMLQFVEALVGVMARVAKGEYVSPQVISLSLQGLTHAVKVKRSYSALKQHLDELAASVVFPLMCFNDEDAELWEEDPQEYIRRGYDILDNPYDVKMSAVNLAHELCMKKKADHVHRFMNLLLQVLNTFQVERLAGAVSQATARRMDGALMAFGTMSNVLHKKKPYKEQLESMLMQHVAPCLVVPQGHLRAKAFWVTSEFAGIAFAGNTDTAKGPNFGALLREVLQGLKDPELPVRVDAGAALRFFIDELPNGDPLTPILPQLVDGIFSLMAEVDSEELVSTLETIIEKVGEAIAPYAVELARRLVAAFDQYCQRTEEDEDEGSFQAEWAAYGCLRALNTLLGNLSELRHVFPPLEGVVFPLMARLLSEDGQDHLEDVLELLTYFTFLTPTISPHLWSLWPKIHKVVMEWGMDYWEHVLRPLDNYISRGTELFLTSTSPDYLASVYQMVEHTLKVDTQEENMLPAVQLLEVVLQNCRGRVDAYLQPYLQLALSKLPTATKRKLRDALMLVVANALYYNPAMALGVLGGLGAVGGVFSQWFQMLTATKPGGSMAHFASPHDKKMVALGLSAVLSVPDEQLPVEVRSGLPQIAHAIPKVLKALQEQQAEIARAEDEEEEDEDEEDADDDDADAPNGVTFEGEDEIDDDDPGYLEKLKKAARDFLGDKNDDDDDSIELDFEDECVFPTDEIDAVTAFAELLRGMQGSNPGRYQALVGGPDGAAMVGSLEALLHAKATAAVATV